MKKFSKILTVVMCFILALSTFTGCKPQSKQDPNTLDIYVLHTGYGHDWAEILKDEFLKQDWVKAKYPNLKVKVGYNDMTGYLGKQMQLGSASKYDLMFAAYAFGYQQNANVVDLTESVYNSTVPGESVKFKDKMNASIYDKYTFNGDGKDKNTAVPFNMGSYSIFYNETKLNEIAPRIGKTVDNVVPVTTDELFYIIESVYQMNNNHETKFNFEAADANGYQKGYPFEYSIMGANNGYEYPMFTAWWAQYEGLHNYENFYYGLVEDMGGSTTTSKNVIKQQGRLESLKVLEECFKYDNHYYVPNPAELDYLQAQVRVFSGKGLFHFNGDYLPEEMKPYYEGIKDEAGDQVVRYMKLPVISSIVDRLPSIATAASAHDMTTDEMLAKLIRDIDNDIATCQVSGVTKADYDALIEARKMIYISSGQCGILPSWSTTQEAAIDFLRFMATDVANAAVITGTGGLMMPFNYDYKENNPEDYANLLASQKDKVDLLSNKVIPAVMVNGGECYPFGKAGLTPLKSMEYNSKVNFGAVFGEMGAKETAQTIYQREIDFYTDELWEQLAQLAEPYFD